MRIIYIFLFLIPISLISQSINLYNINTEKFPLIEADFFVTDSSGNQLTQFTTDDFAITEVQREKTISDIKCPPKSNINKISTVLTLDLSSSMRGAKFEWIKDATSAWIAQMDSTNEETAITTFDDEAILYSDFIIDTLKLLNSINTLELRNGTNYRVAFLDPYAGALDVARRANFQPIIIFLTDGVGTSDFDVNEVVSLAKKMNAVVYAISLEITLPVELKQVTDATGGLYFEEVDNKETLIDVYNTIRKIAVSNSPCSISWFTDGCLIGKKSKIEYKPLGVSKEFSFDAPGIKPPKFEFLDDEFIEFSCQKPNIKYLKLKAINSDIDVNSIDKVNGFRSCDQFEAIVVGKQLPFTLEKDSIMEIRVEYYGTTSDFNLCKFTINSSTCLNVDFFSVSNCIGKPPTNSVVEILDPNGGELLKSGSTQSVQWKGTRNNRTKIVEYSTNKGGSWNQIANGNLEQNITEWKTPNIESSNCLIRIRQMSEDAGRKIYSLNIDSNNVNKVSWNNAGNVFATLSDSATIYVVNSVVGQIANKYKLEKAEDADINFLPDGVRLLYSSESETAVINLITQEYRKISSFGGEIEFSFSNDIGLIQNKNSVHILDLTSLTFINQFDLPNGFNQISDASISNSSDKIVISTSTSTKSDSLYILSKIDNWSNYTTVSMFDNVFEHSYQFVEWSYDEKYVISTSNIGDQKWLELWDVQKLKKIFKKINPTFTSITDLATSDYDNYVVLTDRSFNVKVWEWDELVDTVFSIKFSFKSESSITTDVEWSKDGTRFAVGQRSSSPDSLLSVYSVKPYPEALDISDSTFSLVKNTFSVQDINMGEVLVNSSKDSVFNSIIEYEYDFEFEIDSVVITGVDKNNFSISNSPNLPAVINSINQPNFIIEFKPTKIGGHSAKVILYSKYSIEEFLLFGNGVEPIIGTTNISFDEVNVGVEKTVVESSIFNNGNSVLTIMSLDIVSPSKEQFQLYDELDKVDLIENIEIEANSNFELKVSFTPQNDIVYNSRVRVVYVDEKNNIDTIYIKLDGRGVRPIFEYSDINIGTVKCEEEIVDSLKIYNNGTGDLVIREIQLSSLNFSFNVELEDDYSISEKDSLCLSLLFKPQDNGIIQDSIIFKSNNHSDSVIVIYMNGRKLETSYEIIGDENLIGVDDNKVYKESIKVYNTGRTNLYWDTPSESADGKIIINSVTPNPTLPADTSIIEYTFLGGNKGEIFNHKLSPEPICSDSIEINVEVKSTSPTLYLDYEKQYTIICENELEISIPIINVGEANLVIDSVGLTNYEGNTFNIEDKNIQLSTNQNDSLKLLFKSDIPDIYSINVVIYSNDSKSNDGMTIIPITVIKEVSKFSIIDNDVTFSYLNNNIPGSKTIRIKNEGTVPIRWDVILDSEFTVFPIIPQVAQPGESSVVTFIHTGNKEISSVHKFAVLDSCENKDEVNINIQGVGSEQISLSVIDEIRKIGEVFPLSIKINSSSDFANGEIIKGNLIFNRTIIKPIKTANTTNNEMRSVQFEIKNPKNNEIYQIEMEALWGNDSCTTIEFSELAMEYSSTNIEFGTQSGNFCIEDLCYAAGTRLLKIDYENKNKITINGYDETKILLTVNTIEEGDAIVEIYDFKGTKLREKLIRNSKHKQFSMDIDGFNSGNYFIQVKTYSQVFSKKLILIK